MTSDIKDLHLAGQMAFGEYFAGFVQQDVLVDVTGAEMAKEQFADMCLTGYGGGLCGSRVEVFLNI